MAIYSKKLGHKISQLTLKKPTILGQNFLIDHTMMRKIIQESKINREDVIYEVGTGKGILTTELCKISFIRIGSYPVLSL